MIENLTVLLSDKDDVQEGILFPSEEKIMSILKGDAPVSENTATTDTNDNALVQPNQPVAVIWDIKNKQKWYIGFFLDWNEEVTYCIP